MMGWAQRGTHVAIDALLPFTAVRLSLAQIAVVKLLVSQGAMCYGQA